MMIYDTAWAKLEDIVQDKSNPKGQMLYNIIYLKPYVSPANRVRSRI